MQASDNQTTIGELRKAIGEFVADRSWERFHTPRNLAMSIAIEAAELMELFQWQSSEEAENPSVGSDSGTRVADELADILIYCLALANHRAIDLSSALLAKLAQNADRYPVGSEPP